VGVHKRGTASGQAGGYEIWRHLRDIKIRDVRATAYECVLVANDEPLLPATTGQRAAQQLGLPFAAGIVGRQVDVADKKGVGSNY
jgi:hypothetical protein